MYDTKALKILSCFDEEVSGFRCIFAISSVMAVRVFSFFLMAGDGVYDIGGDI